MYRIIEGRREIRSAIKKFKGELTKDLNRQFFREYQYPGVKGKTKSAFYIDKKPYGIISVGLPIIPWDNRKPHFFNINPPEEGPLAPNLEINIPFKINRRVGGCIVEAKRRGLLLLCHRGIFNAYKGRIPLKVTMKHFKKKLIPVDDGAKISKVIPITTIGSRRFIRNIFDFTEEVLKLKRSYKNKKMK